METVELADYQVEEVFVRQQKVADLRWDKGQLWVLTEGGWLAWDAALNPIDRPGVPDEEIAPLPVEAPFPGVSQWTDGLEIQVAGLNQAAIWNGEWEVWPFAASAVGEGVWGTLDGRILSSEGELLGRVPGRVTAVERIPGGVAAGTEKGVYVVRDGSLQELSVGNAICGNFVTGATRFKGELVVATFDAGACRFDGDRWHRIEGLPSEMLNDVTVWKGAVWFATAEGLSRWDGQKVRTYPTGAGAGGVGTQHHAVGAVASGDKLWVVDSAGPNSFDGKKWGHYRYEMHGTAWQAAAACGSEAWFGAEDAGVSGYDGRWTSMDARKGLPDDWVMAVDCDGERAWAGTYQDGTWEWDGRRWSEVKGIGDDWVLSLAHRKGELWVGTMDGLYLAGKGRVRGLPDERVHQLTVDGDLLLVGTERGFAVVSRRKLVK